MYRALIIAFLCFAGIVIAQDIGSGPADNVCVGCICEAASQCNRTAGCFNGMCGLFRITFPYWVDAGKPVIDLDDPQSPEAWQRCVTEPYCAARTLQGYMTKFSQDCNGDGVINCHDFAAIHHLGGYGCNSRPWDKRYENQFNNCMHSVQQLTG